MPGRTRSLDDVLCSRRFSVQRCARCHLGISASEMVMRARDSVYHLSCFTCTTCNKTLTTGDHFGMKDSLVYCRLHFETLVQGADYHPQLNFAELAAKGGGGGGGGLSLPYFNGTGTAQKGRPRKRKSPAMGIDIPSYNTGEESEVVVGALTEQTYTCTPVEKTKTKQNEAFPFTSNLFASRPTVSPVA